MYQDHLHQTILAKLKEHNLLSGEDTMSFAVRFAANANVISALYRGLYGDNEYANSHFDSLLDTIISAYTNRSNALKALDQKKLTLGHWLTSNEIVGMSLYVDRFCGSIKEMSKKLRYFEELGVNFLHLMPLMESPAEESDGGYAVSDFRKVDKRFGTIEELSKLIQNMKSKDMYLMLDIVLNHTSSQHEWAQKASAGDPSFQNFYYMYDNRRIPDMMEQSMPDIFPDSSPGSFTYDAASGKWVMTVFNYYQWDLNYTNPAVLVAMIDTIFFYANIGVDVLRIDAPAFIWKALGTTSQNLPEAHQLLQLIKHCVQIATPGMALLGEAIVAPKEIIKYFGTGTFTGRECDIAYNATQMALQWDALATGDTRVMLAAQHDILQKPYGPTWITYTRCHDDIGLGYDDEMIRQAGYLPYNHRTYLKDYYSGTHPNSISKGALFGVNPKTNDARISGTLASLCGLEHGISIKDNNIMDQSIHKLLLMQAQSMYLGGLPMLYYGDELGYTNDYSYLDDPAKNYDNRWMHRPMIDWSKNELRKKKSSIENIIFTATKKMIQIRRSHSIFADANNIRWMTPHNVHVASFVRYDEQNKVFCLFNYSPLPAYLTWYTFKEQGSVQGDLLHDLWTDQSHQIGEDHTFLVLQGYQFMVLQMV